MNGVHFELFENGGDMKFYGMKEIPRRRAISLLERPSATVPLAPATGV
jgi:hypothetical protein